MPAEPTELFDYVSRREPLFEWREIFRAGRRLELEMVSQEWISGPWTHEISIVWPEENLHPGRCLLVVTGDRTGSDETLAFGLADMSGMAVATLFQVPNQPIWGLREDALIAYSFAEYLRTGEMEWPLLLPMAKSVPQSLRVIKEAAPGMERFVVTGASKRGWTTWLSAALDLGEIVGIAPVIFDFLNIPAQLSSQTTQFGGYSFMLEDYARYALQQSVDTPRGSKLASIVDPYSYRYSLAAPAFVVRGSNDPFWTVDATSHYWHGLLNPRWLSTMRNVGHAVSEGGLRSIAAFARSCAGEYEMPWQPSLTLGSSGAVFEVDERHLRRALILSASVGGPLPDFRGSEFKVVAGPGALEAAAHAHLALYGEALYEFPGAELTLSTLVEVVPSGLTQEQAGRQSPPL